MRLLDITISNFKKLSALPEPTLVFNPDINVLAGANNAGKTSILKAIQKLFGTQPIEPELDLNYLIQNGNLILESHVSFESAEWEAYLELIQGKKSSNASKLAKGLSQYSFKLTRQSSFINRKHAATTTSVALDEQALVELNITNPEEFTTISMLPNEIAQTDFYNVYNTPLYLDSKGMIAAREQFVALNQLESRKIGSQVNIRGLLYALKKKDIESFNHFKRRLLEIFTELQDIDVVHNEDMGQFELILHERLLKNGDSQEVQYDINNVGQGMQALVLMLSNILLLRPKIVLMDEPEVHMHPSLIKEFIKYVKLLSIDTQFIITTHSLVLIQEAGLDKVFYLKNEPMQKGVVAVKVDDRNRLFEAVTGLGYDVDTLTYTIRPAVFVFTEGTSDKDLILGFAIKAGLSKIINTFTTAFIAMEGKGNRYKLANLIEKLNKEFVEAPILMILDRDETTTSSIEDITNKFFAKNPKRVHYLGKRQIENYLLDTAAIGKVVVSKIKEPEVLARWMEEDIPSKMLQLAENQKEKILHNYLSELFINDSLVNTRQLDEILKSLSSKPLNQSVPEFTGELFKLVGTRTALLSQKTSSALTEFETVWNAGAEKLEMCDGRELLKSIRRWVQDDYRVSFSADELIDAMESIPTEIEMLLLQLTRPDQLKITA
jgi:AAA15 family ATPase/GTPase